MESIYKGKYKKEFEILINDLSKEYCNYVDNYEEYIKVSTSDQKALIGDIPQSIIFVPIYFNEKVVGIISTQAYKKNSYSLRDVMTLDILATYMGIALENNRLYKKLEYNANYDRLTNVLNRGAILRKCEEVRGIIQEGNDDYYIGMIDIDNFKHINDTYGHLVGDSVLEKVSNACKVVIGDNGFIGRYGGEEFIIIYKDNNRSLSEEIRTSIENIKVYNDINVTGSIGITKLVGADILLEEIINRADIALYEAKNTGKNKVIIYS